MPTQFITREEAAQLRLLPFGKKHPVRILIERMQPGEILRISREDFNWKHHTTNHFCNQISKKNPHIKFEMTTIQGDVGWVVERIS